MMPVDFERYGRAVVVLLVLSFIAFVLGGYELIRFIGWLCNHVRFV